MPSFPASTNAYQVFLCDELQCKADYVESLQNSLGFLRCENIMKLIVVNGSLIARNR